MYNTNQLIFKPYKNSASTYNTINLRVVGNLYRHTSYKTVTVKTALLAFIFIIAFISCSDLFEAGNLVDLSYPIQTPLRTEIIERYIDTLIQTKGFAVPNKWNTWTNW